MIASGALCVSSGIPKEKKSRIVSHHLDCLSGSLALLRSTGAINGINQRTRHDNANKANAPRVAMMLPVRTAMTAPNTQANKTEGMKNHQVQRPKTRTPWSHRARIAFLDCSLTDSARGLRISNLCSNPRGPATFHEWQYLFSSFTHGGSHHYQCIGDYSSLCRRREAESEDAVKRRSATRIQLSKGAPLLGGSISLSESDAGAPNLAAGLVR